MSVKWLGPALLVGAALLVSLSAVAAPTSGLRDHVDEANDVAMAAYGLAGDLTQQALGSTPLPPGPHQQLPVPDPSREPQQPATPSAPPTPLPAVPPTPVPPAPQPNAVLSALRHAMGTAIQALREAPDAVMGAANQARATADDAARRVREAATPEDSSPEPVPAPATAATSASGGFPLPILAGGILVAGAAGATFIGLWIAGSSGTLGAGAAGAAGAKSSELRRLLPLASPLFSRFEKETVLGHPRREALYAAILQHPGISLQALGNQCGLSRTAVLHHLRLMEHQHLIVSKRIGRNRHYYENGGRFGRDQKEALAILQNPRTKDVSDYIRSHPGLIQKALCGALSLQPSVAHWHVQRLLGANLVQAVRQGRTVAYYPAEAAAPAAQVPALPLSPIVA